MFSPLAAELEKFLQNGKIGLVGLQLDEVGAAAMHHFFILQPPRLRLLREPF